ncbi:hypothetical protein E4U47_006413, partial [Claviceps purpurea]
MDSPQAEAVRAATEDITDENPAIDSASDPSRCCSGCRRALPLSAFPLKPRTGERALQCELCKARYAKRRHPTQDPEQDADDQDDGPPPASRRRLNTEAPAVDSSSVPPTCCSGRQAERRHPTQDPEQTAPPHPEHLDEQDAD